MFAGLSAFPLTPMDERGIDEAAFAGLVARLAEAGVDSIGALGSTGNSAYLRREERLTQEVNLPRPLRPLDAAGRRRLEQALSALAVP